MFKMNTHFCQGTIKNINQANGAQTSQPSVEKTESSQSNVEKASSLCSYKKMVATKLNSYLIKTTRFKKEAIN